VWLTPPWSDVWFPDAFQGPMGEVMDAIDSGREPVSNGADNLKTMAIIEAGYRSIHERRSVPLVEIMAQALQD
jgi:predicted dehydrogenase